MKISNWVDFHLSDTHAWVRNSTPSQFWQMMVLVTLTQVSQQEVVLQWIVDSSVVMKTAICSVINIKPIDGWITPGSTAYAGTLMTMYSPLIYRTVY